MNRLALLLALLMASPALYAAEKKMFEKMRTYCFGRYLVDIPYEAELDGQLSKYMNDTIQTVKTSDTSLKAKIDKKMGDLKKKAFPYYELSKEINNGSGVILLGYKEAFKDPMYSIDTFKWDRGYAFITSGASYSDKGIDRTVSLFADYLKNVRYRSDRDIPKEPGFCIENGFILNNGKSPQFEMASITFALKNNPDVWFSIDSFTLSKPEPSLLERQKAAKLDERFPGKIKAIRKGARTVNGMQGEESLNEFPSDNGMGVAHSFMWEAQGGFDNPLNPKVSIQLTSGEGVAGVTGESSLSAAQMQRLYESVIKSIRVRPTAQ
ncbi:hypothetical protein HA052_10100 [Chromobacterium haemolyticum]|uniref:Tle cognate immunity protein 4 C-terminal domain-containing protein n=1 Tax=Chromobacterium fluminis TaxID=3044269 RepID=A0ABX0L7M0_9NEIS|nr:T6SS immunity protein Tli4 family protein [Chromobacterium haemolyticum]NHR05556.1 hypothetical protein [Chromobacterium haemolyticum]